MRLIIQILILNFIFLQLIFAQTKIKNIFDPNNVQKENKNQNKITKNFDFILYGIINTKNLKMVLIKPKVITREVRKKMGKSKYITLKIGEEFQNIKLVSIDNDTAKFKKGEKIIAMRVFQNIKNDRIKIATAPVPAIINNAPRNVPATKPTPKRSVKPGNRKSNNFIVIPSAKKRANNNRIKSKPHVNPFLELLKRAHQNRSNTPSRPITNPFLELLKRGRR